MNFLFRVGQFFEKLGKRAEEKRQERLKKQLAKAKRKVEKLETKLQKQIKIDKKIKTPSSNDERSNKKIIDEKVEKERYGKNKDYLLSYLDKLYNVQYSLIANEEAKTELTKIYVEFTDLINSEAITSQEVLEDKWYAEIRALQDKYGL